MSPNAANVGNVKFDDSVGCRNSTYAVTGTAWSVTMVCAYAVATSSVITEVASITVVATVKSAVAVVVVAAVVSTIVAVMA